ncbi:helix-turn-helix transcriptional regulator [Cohnella terricola]|uniref:Helix-turn-helix transcriptional regulator n=1 Tax=Cohnella terricola TaxID=1289167 RepID=A0A559JIK0_9BACL|nr:helix-turn-helix transcriptional regulator [Cohnella terricola]TVX99700.1 helix-turn-helix transcriptional regulator [Cohnella terricola]
MELLEFNVPPMLHYISSGHTEFAVGDRHLSRRNIRVFDLLAVTHGCIYIREEDRHYEVSAGNVLILRPDVSHYATEGCRSKTGHYWLHFQTTGAWQATNAFPPRRAPESSDVWDESRNFFASTSSLVLPQYTKLVQPGKFWELIDRINELTPEAHLNASRLQQQFIFQEVIRHLSVGIESEPLTPASACAEQAAAYLRARFREEITARSLGEALNFHPVYIARCMQKEYGLSPMSYLLRYRIEQSKLLLMQTDYSIARIAEEVGFNQTAYFSSCFQKIEGISPRHYRQRFSQG